MKKNIPKSNRKNTLDTKQQKSNKIDFQKWINPFNLLLLSVYIGVAFYTLAVSNTFLILKIQEFSLFLPTQYFFFEQFKLPAALLTYLSSFFIQFFYYPWLGSSIFILMSLLVQYLFMRTFDVGKLFYAFTFVIPFALLLTITQLGYMIFAVKLNYFIYTLSVGLSFVFLLYWVYKHLKSIVSRTLLSAFAPFLFYPLFGFYSVLLGVFFCLTEIRFFFKTKQIIHFLPLAVGIVFCAFIPYLYYHFVYTQIDFTQIYIIGLPQLFDTEWFCWVPFLAIGLLILFWYVFSLLFVNGEPRIFTILVGLVIYVLSVVGLFHYSYFDANFNVELAMDKAVSENRWDDVLNQANQLKDEPTRLLVMYPRLALQKLNRGGDELFHYPNGNKQTNSPWPTELLSLAGKQFYYQYGKLNYSYQAAFDDMVERGMKVDDLNYLIKNALLNNEFKLAQKYNDLLGMTFFYKDKAAKYQHFIDNPTSMQQDVEFSSILSLTSNANEVYDAGAMETYLLQDFARNAAQTTQYMEIAIQNALILRNSSLFWSQFLPYAQLATRIPRHYQEAAVFFAFYERNVDIQDLNIDPAIIAEFHEFEHFLDQNRANTKEMNKNLLRPAFGNTFWYYCFFSEPIINN